MKTTKQRLLSIIIASSIAINLVMLGALGYIASLDNVDARLESSMKAPVFILVPKTAEKAVAIERTTEMGLSSVK